MPTTITDQQLFDALTALKAAGDKTESLKLELERLQARAGEIQNQLDDNEEYVAGQLMARMMVERNLQVLFVGDDVVTLISNNKVSLATGVHVLGQVVDKQPPEPRVQNGTTR